MRVVREEIFGPVGVITTFTDIDDAIAQANDTDYGLAAPWWTTDLATAHRMAAAIEAGNRLGQHLGRDEHRQPPLRRLQAVRLAAKAVWKTRHLHPGQDRPHRAVTTVTTTSPTPERPGRPRARHRHARPFPDGPAWLVRVLIDPTGNASDRDDRACPRVQSPQRKKHSRARKRSGFSSARPCPRPGRWG
ncbi:hypothetical protein GCM10023238_32440 [Streptomyces heliomycini]